MLWFKRLFCENFLPYVKEEFSFPEDKKKGIVIINGQNGHGKSSLLDALRFVLFGELQNDKSKNSLFNAINREGFANGKYDCKVSLHVRYLDQDYQIIRTYAPKKGKQTPKSGADYDPPKLQVITGEGYVMSEEEQTKLLARMMNRNVARFYLFDGELLDEYNQILSGPKLNESNKIKESIENILGLPILTNTRDHLEILLEEWNQEITKIAKENKNTEQIAAIVTEEKKNIDYYTNQIDNANDKLIDINNKIDDIERKLNNSRDDIENINKKESLQKSLIQINENIDDNISERAKLLKKAWAFMLYPLISEKENELNAEYTNYTDIFARIQERASLIQYLHNSLSRGVCTQCGQELNNEAITSIKKQLDQYNSDRANNKNENEQEIQTKKKDLENTFECIKKYREQYIPNFREGLEKLDNNINDLECKRDMTLVELNNVEKMLRELHVTDSNIKSLYKDLDTEHQKKREWEYALAENKKKFDDAKEKYDAANKRLGEYANKEKNLQKAMVKKEMVEKILKIFEGGIEIYRTKKREDVEKVASEIYCKLSTFDYIGGLHITEDYGVVPYNTSGKELPSPSSGYAHLEAFALIGGLHKNVPIKGPLFLDTPAGRLDKSNTRNLIQCIPDLSDQVILFIHDKDFDSKDLHYYLSDEIVAEYTIEKISETQSCITRSKEI